MMYEPSADLAICVKYLLAANGDMLTARALAERHRAPERVRRIFEKSATGAGHFGGSSFGEILGDWTIAEAGFFASLRTRSIFFRLLDSGFRKVPLRTRLGIVTASATAWARGEGRALAVSGLALSGPTLAPISATALTVFTDEVAREMNAAGQALVATELRGAAADEVDREFLASIIDSGTPSFASTGSDLAAMKNDLRALLSAVSLTGAGDLFWCLSPDAAIGAAVLDDRGAMGPLGGELLNLPAMVSGVIPAGTLYLIDASQIAANADGIDIEVSREAALEMDSSPVGNALDGTGAPMISLWQSGSVGVKATVSFGAEKVHGSAIAELADIAWALPAS